MAKYGLLCNSEHFNISEKPGHVVLGYSIGLEKLNLILVYEKINTEKLVSIKAPAKKTNPFLQLVEIDKNCQLIKIDSNKIGEIKLEGTTHVFFQKQSINKIIKGYSELLFTTTQIKLGYSIVSNKSNISCVSLKCQGVSPRSLKIAKMTPSNGGENSSNTSNGTPIPPEYNP